LLGSECFWNFETFKVEKLWNPPNPFLGFQNDILSFPRQSSPFSLISF
jgi:hypothetical protein